MRRRTPTASTPKLQLSPPPTTTSVVMRTFTSSVIIKLSLSFYPQSTLQPPVPISYHERSSFVTLHVIMPAMTPRTIITSLLPSTCSLVARQVLSSASRRDLITQLWKYFWPDWTTRACGRWSGGGGKGTWEGGRRGGVRGVAVTGTTSQVQGCDRRSNSMFKVLKKVSDQ